MGKRGERKGEERRGGEGKWEWEGRGEERSAIFFKWKKNLQNLRLGKEIYKRKR